jgi:hypothetical protein
MEHDARILEGHAQTSSTWKSSKGRPSDVSGRLRILWTRIGEKDVFAGADAADNGLAD